METITIDTTAADLLTIAGASVAAAIVTQFAKTLFGFHRRVLRFIAAGSALAVVGIAYATSADPTPIGIVAALLVGLQAGLAAIAGADIAKSGIDHRTVSTE